MARNIEDEHKMRELVNEIINLFNTQLADLTLTPSQQVIETIHDKLERVWTTYFSDGRLNDTSDREILAALVRIPFSRWPPSIVLDVISAFTGQMGRPATTIYNHSRLNPESRYLQEFASDKTSQSGEDGIIERVFEIMGTENKWCVEFGAWDGMRHSNTYTLITENEWHGVLIEPKANRYESLKSTYRGNDKVTLLNEMVGSDPNRDSLDFLLGQTDIPQDFDLLVVDIDGNDWHIWDSITHFRPRVIVIEHNPTTPNDVLFVQQRDPAVQLGSSLLAMIKLGKKKGYELVATTAFNGIFVVQEEFSNFGIEDNSIEAMYSPTTDGRIFHGYDSSIHALGMPTLVWDWQGKGRDWTKFDASTFSIYDR